LICSGLFLTTDYTLCSFLAMTAGGFNFDTF
jgi:hypothetical protein